LKYDTIIAIQFKKNDNNQCQKTGNDIKSQSIITVAKKKKEKGIHSSNKLLFK